MVTREKNGDGEIRGKAIEARRGEAARASAAVARVGRAPDGAARARAWIRRGEGVERAQLKVRVPRGANSDGPRGAAVRATKKKLSSSRSVHSYREKLEKNTIQLFFPFDPAHLAFRCKYPYDTALVLRPVLPGFKLQSFERGTRGRSRAVGVAGASRTPTSHAKNLLEIP
jgi:hypothetical protein